MTITESQLASVLDEIASAMLSGTPLDQAFGRLRNRRLGAIGRISGQIADHVSRGGSAADAFTANAPLSRLADRAIRNCERTGDGNLLRRLAADLRRRDRMRRETTLAWIYPAVLLFIAYFVFVGVMAPLVVRHAGPAFQWAEWVEGVSRWCVEYWTVPPAVFLTALCLGILLRGRSRGLPGHASWSLMYHSLADQVRLDVPEPDAVRTAMVIAGFPEDTAARVETFQTLIDGSGKSYRGDTLAALSIARFTPAGFSGPAKRLGENDKDFLVAMFKMLDDAHRRRWNRVRGWWVRILPKLGMTAIAGCSIVLYVFWVLGPVYSQVHAW